MKSGKYIKKVRAISGLTQKQLAEEMEVNQSYISRLEGDKVDISLSSFLEICRKLGVDDYNEVFE